MDAAIQSQQQQHTHLDIQVARLAQDLQALQDDVARQQAAAAEAASTSHNRRLEYQELVGKIADVHRSLVATETQEADARDRYAR